VSTITNQRLDDESEDDQVSSDERVARSRRTIEDHLLHNSIHSLREHDPDQSASTNLHWRQVGGVAIGLIVLITLFIYAAKVTAQIIVLLATIVYVAVLTYRIRLFISSSQSSAQISISDAEARAVADEDLPRYTVLIPCYREPSMIGELVRSIGEFEYPTSKLDVKFLLEADDYETVSTALFIDPGPPFDVVLVPAADPRTKPKALNYGLQLAEGDYVTVYDAEDKPEPLQLRRAVVAFDRVDDSVACIQARLVYHNPDQNLITRWFALEYIVWFSQFLPGLVQRDAPIPLGGTSNHFRRELLEEVGGWDPFNVTEDADLGMRLHRRGFRTAMLDSITYEEANSDFVNWIKQRSRWYKGYLQTWAVHLRHPRGLWNDLGPRGFLEFNLFVGGTPIMALVNPIFWLLSILWFVTKPVFIEAIFPGVTYYAAVASWLAGNAVLTYINVLVAYDMSASVVGRKGLHRAALLTPLYWVMMSIAAAKAGFQFIFEPSRWEKTVHGLDRQPSAPPIASL
jgi:cellulose synthase/poly-beta-1,6-N-acetylglucosamine synthase-like glycosyltransferase